MKRKFNRNVSIMLASTVMLTTAFSNVSFANAKETPNIVSNKSISLLNDVSVSEGAIYVLTQGAKPSQAIQTETDKIPENAMALKMNVPKLQYKKGDIAVVDLYLENNVGFTSIGFNLEYDEAYLKLLPLEEEDNYESEEGFVKYEADGNKKTVISRVVLNKSVDAAKGGVLKFAISLMDSANTNMIAKENGKLTRIKFEVIKEGKTSFGLRESMGAFMGNTEGHSVVPTYTQDGVINIGDTTIGKKEAVNFTVGQNNKVAVKANEIGATPTVTATGTVFEGSTTSDITAESAIINVSEKSMGTTTIDDLIAELVGNVAANGISAAPATNDKGQKGLVVNYGGEGQNQKFGIYFNVVPIAYENANFKVGSSEVVTVVADNTDGTSATVTPSGSVLGAATATVSATDASATISVPKSALGGKKLFSIVSGMADTFEGNAKKVDLGDNILTVTYGENQTYVIRFETKDDSTPDPDPDDNGSSSGGGGGGGGSSLTAAKQTDKEDIKDPEIPGPGTTTPSGSVSFVTKTGVKITPPTVSLGTKTFTDISSRPWAEASINKLASYGIINGIGNGKFAPDANSKRADFMVMMSKVLGLTVSVSSNFDDVSSDKYYADAVGQLKEIGIASGVGNNKFNPESTITRQDMMAIVARALDMMDALPQADAAVLDKFDDRDKVAPYAVDSLASLVELGIVSGTGANLEPTALITRAQMSVIMSKVYDIVVDKAYEAQEESTTTEEDSTETTTGEEDSTETTTDEEDSTETTTDEEDSTETTTEEE